MSIVRVQVRSRMTSGGSAMTLLRNECNARLFNTIEQLHSVTSTDLAAVRMTLAHKGVDLPVNIPLAALFLLSAIRTARWLRTRFASDERAAKLVATAIGSIFLAATMTLFGQLWAAAIEMLRLGNEHLSFRLARLSWRQHFTAVFVIQVIVFWVAVVLEGMTHRIKPLSSTDHCV